MNLFIQGLSVKNAARWQPRFDTEEVSSPYNPFLMFAVGCGLWFLFVLGPLLLRRLGSIFYGWNITDFIDLCSLGNISVLILDEPMHGYYIHGKAPGGRGDCSGTLMSQRLKEEQDGTHRFTLKVGSFFWPESVV